MRRTQVLVFLMCLVAVGGLLLATPPAAMAAIVVSLCIGAGCGIAISAVQLHKTIAQDIAPQDMADTKIRKYLAKCKLVVSTCTTDGGRHEILVTLRDPEGYDIMEDSDTI